MILYSVNASILKTLDLACSFTQSLTQSLTHSIWSIQLDNLIIFWPWEDNSVARLSCMTYLWLMFSLMANLISRTFLYLGQFQWCDAFTLFLIFYKNTIVLNYLLKKSVYRLVNVLSYKLSSHTTMWTHKLDKYISKSIVKSFLVGEFVYAVISHNQV